MTTEQSRIKHVNAIVQMLERKKTAHETLLKQAARVEDGEVMEDLPSKDRDEDVEELMNASLTSREEIVRFQPLYDQSELRKYISDVSQYVSKNRKRWIELIASSQPALPSRSVPIPGNQGPESILADILSEKDLMDAMKIIGEKIDNIRKTKTFDSINTITPCAKNQARRLDKLELKSKTEESEIEEYQHRLSTLEQGKDWSIQKQEFEQLIQGHQLHLQVIEVTEMLTKKFIEEQIASCTSRADCESNEFCQKLNEETDEAIQVAESMAKAVLP